MHKEDKVPVHFHSSVLHVVLLSKERDSHCSNDPQRCPEISGHLWNYGFVLLH